jgi:hypothetical protein
MCGGGDPAGNGVCLHAKKDTFIQQNLYTKFCRDLQRRYTEESSFFAKKLKLPAQFFE